MFNANEITDLFNNIFLQELSYKLSEVGSSTYVHSASVSIPIFRCSVETKHADIHAQLHMASEAIVLSVLNIHCTLPYYAAHYDKNRLTTAIKYAFSQVYHNLLDVPLNCLIVEVTDKLFINWYINHVTTDANVNTRIDFKSVYGLGAVIYTPIDILKKFPGNRLKLITNISQNGGYVHTSITIKDIKQLHENAHTKVYISNR